MKIFSLIWLLALTAGAQTARNQFTTNQPGATVIGGIHDQYGFQKDLTNYSSASTTVQIDTSLRTAYVWTNMTANVTCQWTNLVPGKDVDFFFEGAVSGGSDYTVTFTCPNPGGVVFWWTHYAFPTNGATSFTVTNGHAASAFGRVWTNSLGKTNVEAVYVPLR